MVKVVTVAEMQDVEKAADAKGLNYDEMMANAGRSVAQSLLERTGPIEGKRVLLLVGSGNNGGDVLVAGWHLLQAGAEVTVYLAKERPKKDPLLERLREQEVLIAEADQDQRWRVLRNAVGAADVLVDGVFGTGLTPPLRGTAQEVLKETKRALDRRDRRPFVLAVDCPSGLDCDSGQVADETLAADATVTLAAVKVGLLRFPGAAYVGEIVVGDIGLKSGQTDLDSAETDLATADSVAAWLPARKRDSHKGTYGTAIIVAGSINLPGAAVLAGLSAYRSGAGLVRLAVPSSIQALLAPQLPEAVWTLLPHEMGLLDENAVPVLREALEGVDAMLVGPGLGLDGATRRFVARLLGLDVAAHRGKLGFVARGDDDEPARVPLPDLVVDADGLKLLAELPDWPGRLPAPAVLTPHPGEMSILCGDSIEEVQADRVEVARRYAKKWGHIVVLKGAFTVVAAPDGRTTVIPFATSALATAGTGDVLAGVVVGLLAQGVEAFEAAVAAAYLHGRAGELAALALGTEASVIAGDVADMLPDAIAELGAEI
ncbi:MAG: NAD(P)H-hydrate dehydratase [Anaerolineales bacterium]